MLSMPNWGPLFFLERGFTDAFTQSMHLLTFNHQWDEIIRIVNIIFDKAIALGSEENTATETGDVREHYMNASREWSVWTSAINANKNLSNGRE